MKLLLPAAAWGLAALLGAVVFWEYQGRHAADAALAPPSPRPAAVGRDTAAAPPADLSPRWVETLLARPLFSPSRRPLAVAGPLAAAATPLPRLTGVVVSASTRGAIFAAQAGGKGIVVSEGDWIAGYRVRSIAAGLVILLGPEGELALRPTFAPVAATPPATGAPITGAPITGASAVPMSTLMAPSTDIVKPSVLDQLRQAAAPLAGIPGLAVPAPQAAEEGMVQSPAPEAAR